MSDVRVWIFHYLRKDGIAIVADRTFERACSRFYLDPAKVPQTRQPLGVLWAEEIKEGEVRFYGGAVVSGKEGA